MRLELVDGHRRCADTGVAAHDDEWHVAVQFGHRLNDTPDGCDHNDSLYVGGPQPVERRRHVTAAPVQGHEAQCVAGLAGRRLNGEQHVGRAELLGFDRHHPQGA